MSEDPKLRRDDKNPGALISTDTEGLVAYKKRKRAFGEINILKRKHEEVVTELADIKMMLKHLLERLDK